MKHFQNSDKSLSLLNDTLVVFSMTKVHLMTFCPTRVSYLLDSCLQAVELFIPLYDALTTIGIKKEKTDSFLAPKNLFIRHILADLQPSFYKYLLKACVRYFPSNVSPKAFQPISQFLLCHSEKKGTTSKRVA